LTKQNTIAVRKLSSTITILFCRQYGERTQLLLLGHYKSTKIFFQVSRTIIEDKWWHRAEYLYYLNEHLVNLMIWWWSAASVVKCVACSKRKMNCMVPFFILERTESNLYLSFSKCKLDASTATLTTNNYSFNFSFLPIIRIKPKVIYHHAFWCFKPLCMKDYEECSILLLIKVGWTHSDTQALFPI